ncbi:MAG: hypothetical protein HC779_00040 [Phyllobacteriaceae bacterium]|nr:hypothetical protein [Phyllobacteriaceae bacterium]
MIVKAGLAGLVAVAAALGAGYFAIGAAGHADPAADPAHFGGLDYVKLEPFAVPVIEDGALEGYVLTELVFTIDAHTKASLSVPPEFFIREDAFRSIYGEVAVDFDNLDRVDLEALGESIRGNVNARLETEAIASVLVQRFDYVARGAIRDNAVREQP